MNPGALGRQGRHIHVFYLKKALWQNILQKNVFKTILQHKQDKAFITYFYHY